MPLLKDLLQEKLTPKHYYRNNKTGKYRIVRNGVQYMTCDTEEQAKKGVELLKQNNWSLSKTKEIKEQVGIIRQNKNNKTGFLNVYIESNEKYSRNYRYVYSIKTDGKIIRMTSTSLKKLRKKVIEKGLKWQPLTDDAKKIDKILESDK